VRNPPPFPQGPGKIPECLRYLFDAVQSLRPIAGPGEIVEHTSRGVRRRLAKTIAPPRSEPVEFRRLRVTREGWAAVEGEDDDGNLIVALKPASILFTNGIDISASPTAWDFAGHTLTAAIETDYGTWPQAEGFFLKVRNIDVPGKPNEYWHEVVWPPYIGKADSVTSGCRAHSGNPEAFLVAARGNFALPGVFIDDVTLDYYDEISPVGDSVAPEWTDANFDARRWTPWTLAGNGLALDGDGLHVPNL